MTATPVRPQKPQDEYGRNNANRYESGVMPAGAFKAVYSFKEDDRTNPHKSPTSRPEEKRFSDKGGPTHV